jgi:hypothetical protein
MNAPHSSLAILRRIKAAARAELYDLVKADGGGKLVTEKDRRNFIRQDIASIIKAAP